MKNILEALNTCYWHELGMVARYLEYTVHLPEPEGRVLADFFRKRAGDCLDHAYSVVGQILTLGGVPRGRIAPAWRGPSPTSGEMLTEALGSKEAAVEIYRRAILQVGREPGLKDPLASILSNEESALREIRSLLDRRDGATG